MGDLLTLLVLSIVSLGVVLFILLLPVLPFLRSEVPRPGLTRPRKGASSREPTSREQNRCEAGPGNPYDFSLDITSNVTRSLCLIFQLFECSCRAVAGRVKPR